MSSQAVGRRYAVALADVVLSRGEAQEVREELAAWDTLVGTNSQLLEVFRHPAITHEQKRGVLSANAVRFFRLADLPAAEAGPRILAEAR